MKKKVLLVILILFLLVGCESSKSNKTKSKKEMKSEYAKILAKYIDSVTKLVNEAKSFKLYGRDTIYLIPVGNDKKKSCATLKSNGESPFSKEWEYAYVTVTYDYDTAKYYYRIIAKDGAGYGVTLSGKTYLEKKGADEIIEIKDEYALPGYDILADYYNYSWENTVFSKNKNSNDYKKLHTIVSDDSWYDYIVIIGANECRYSSTVSYY